MGGNEPNAIASAVKDEIGLFLNLPAIAHGKICPNVLCLTITSMNQPTAKQEAALVFSALAEKHVPSLACIESTIRVIYDDIGNLVMPTMPS